MIVFPKIFCLVYRQRKNLCTELLFSLYKSMGKLDAAEKEINTGQMKVNWQVKNRPNGRSEGGQLAGQKEVNWQVRSRSNSKSGGGHSRS